MLCVASTASARPPSRILEKRIGGKVAGELRLGGRVRVTEDLIVLPGASLAFERGSVVTFDRSESTKVEPESFFGGTEIVVRGRLRAEETEFRFADREGGVVVDGGFAELAGVSVSGAEAGLAVLGGGTVRAAGPVGIRDCRVGLALFPSDRGGIEGAGEVKLTGNGVGAVRLEGSPPLPGAARFGGNEEADTIDWDGGNPVRGAGPELPAPPPVPAAGALRLGDVFLDRDRTLEGDVIVDGIVRVAPGVTLTITAGSRLFFAFRDTDGDGIGENGLFLQGTLRAIGSVERPIRFLPEGPGGRGRWDSINFMASDREKNVLKHVVVEGAYRGLHAHFSRIEGSAIRIARCYRGLQFQESEVDLADVDVSDVVSVLRCRDSTVRIERVRAARAGFGANFFRSAVTLVDPRLSGGWYGLRFRESRAETLGGALTGNFVGLSVQEGRVALEGVSADAAGLAGFALQDGDVTMTRCRASGSRVDGVSATRARVLVSGGALRGFGRHAVKLAGPAEVRLRGVDLGAPARRGAPVIHDGRSAPGLGIVAIE